MTPTTPIEGVAAIMRHDAVSLAATENLRCVEVLAALEDSDWAKQTDCPQWDVRGLAGHVLGALETFVGFRPLIHVLRTASKQAGDGLVVDAMTALQVRERAGLTTGELVARARIAAPKNARWRGQRRLIRGATMKQPMSDGTVEKWKLSYLLDVILTRDLWMHRVDLALATGRDMVLSPDHDGRIVADVVAEWARRHRGPFELHLSGPAGGSFSAGRDGAVLELDAVEFCRILSGRAPGEGLLTQEVPF